MTMNQIEINSMVKTILLYLVHERLKDLKTMLNDNNHEEIQIQMNRLLNMMQIISSIPTK